MAPRQLFVTRAREVPASPHPSLLLPHWVANGFCCCSALLLSTVCGQGLVSPRYLQCPRQGVAPPESGNRRAAPTLPNPRGQWALAATPGALRPFPAAMVPTRPIYFSVCTQCALACIAFDGLHTTLVSLVVEKSLALSEEAAGDPGPCRSPCPAPQTSFLPPNRGTAQRLIPDALGSAIPAPGQGGAPHMPEERGAGRPLAGREGAPPAEQALFPGKATVPAPGRGRFRPPLPLPSLSSS